VNRRILAIIALIAAALLPVRGFAAPIAAAMMADCPHMVAMAQMSAAATMATDSGAPCEHCDDAGDTASNTHHGQATAHDGMPTPACDQGCGLCALACGVVALDATPEPQQAYACALPAAGKVSESFASAERHSTFKPPIPRA
jgi:hypothetical protein